MTPLLARLGLLTLATAALYGAAVLPAPPAPPVAAAATQDGGAEGQADGHADGAAPTAKLPPHARAPRNVPLEIHERAQFVAPSAEALEAMAAAEPGRFTEQDGYLVDSQGVYFWDEENEIYWQWVEADVLTRGRQDFVQFCSSCHGLEGDGYGRSAQHLRPPPRSFQQSTFKFTKVNSQFLPSDAALVQLVRKGLDGTPMLAWDVSEQRLHDIVQYIKFLSPEDSGWRDPTNEIADIIETGDDPWAGRESEAIAAGRDAYHKRGCQGCHPSYLSAGDLNALLGNAASTAQPENLTYSKLKSDSSYDVQGYKVAIPSPDFTWHTLRASRDVRETYQTIAAGIGGAAMPTWKGGMPDEEIWAISHYVRSLVDTYKDQPARAAYMAGLRGK
ncbi:MAG: c-type cytochrome [Planctomycetota bacterium]